MQAEAGGAGAEETMDLASTPLGGGGGGGELGIRIQLAAAPASPAVQEIQRQV